VLEFQRRRGAEGRPLLLGQAVVELGFLDKETLDRAVTEQILRFRAALEDANRNLEYRVQQRTAELEEALRKLSELNQLKANFVANVSHELRTPLTHIRGYLDLLDTESLGHLNEGQKKAVDVSLRSTARLQNLIDDLILFSQVARGELTLTLRPVDLQRVIANVVSHANPKADDKGVTLKVAVGSEVMLVKADEEKLSWVLTQLLDNSIKFTPQGGKVLLSASVDDKNKNMVLITVSDTGIGIPPERVKEIFEPFHQLDGSATRRYGGTGLGLSLVREIIQAHGSLIDVKSEQDKGTSITFPLLAAKVE
jgi:signal transduction histidine kinase